MYVIASNWEDALIILDESQHTNNKPMELNEAKNSSSSIAPSLFADFPKCYANHRRDQGAKEPSNFKSKLLFTAIDTGKKTYLNSKPHCHMWTTTKCHPSHQQLSCPFFPHANAGIKGAEHIEIPAVIIRADSMMTHEDNANQNPYIIYRAIHPR